MRYYFRLIFAIIDKFDWLLGSYLGLHSVHLIVHTLRKKTHSFTTSVFSKVKHITFDDCTNVIVSYSDIYSELLYFTDWVVIRWFRNHVRNCTSFGATFIIISKCLLPYCTSTKQRCAFLSSSVHDIITACIGTSQKIWNKFSTTVFRRPDRYAKSNLIVLCQFSTTRQLDDNESIVKLLL